MTRFALYFTPEDDSDLARFGWWWLGRTPDMGATALPALGLDPAWHDDVVAAARGYGFHATLKAPFRLAAGCDEQALREAAASFACERQPFTEPPLVLAPLHGFLALRPSRSSPDIARLAEDCVRAFDRFRAPATEADLRKRLAVPLSERQRVMLHQWGYPYVFDEFRFHMTLTRKLAEDERAALADLIGAHAAPALREPVEFRSLALFRQEAPGAPFVRIARFPFGG